MEGFVHVPVYDIAAGGASHILSVYPLALCFRTIYHLKENDKNDVDLHTLIIDCLTELIGLNIDDGMYFLSICERYAFLN